jgi:hypothetical protein
MGLRARFRDRVRAILSATAATISRKRRKFNDWTTAHGNTAPKRYHKSYLQEIKTKMILPWRQSLKVASEEQVKI